MRHLHLDPLGGIAGDMFVAALLDLMPEHRDDVVRGAESLAGVPCRLHNHSDATLIGKRFEVNAAEAEHAHHVHWRAIRARLGASDLSEPVRAHAIGIFGCLAEAEARVHGVTPDAVAFHEVGAADSIADIVAAAWLIAAIGPATWTVGALPIGSGRVRTAHGVMPVPTPATALLIEGLATQDDGIEGERVTPTGAAILRHLAAASARRPPAILRGSGYGFGTRALPGISNCLRVLSFDLQTSRPSQEHRELAVIAFEIDDQSGEELAAGLDRVREAEGVHDVIQIAAFGKKGRLTIQVQVLARPDCLDAAIDVCFRETTTIGLRTYFVQGRALARRFAEIEGPHRSVRVKLVERPDGVTGKIESDHVLGLAGHAARTRLRRDAERRAENGT